MAFGIATSHGLRMVNGLAEANIDFSGSPITNIRSMGKQRQDPLLPGTTLCGKYLSAIHSAL